MVSIASDDRDQDFLDVVQLPVWTWFSDRAPQRAASGYPALKSQQEHCENPCADPIRRELFRSILTGTYALYAAAAALSLPFVWIAVRETKGKTLEQMKDATNLNRALDSLKGIQV